MLLQLATVYLFAGLHTLFGAPWLDASAAGVVLRIDRFSLPSVSRLVFENELLSRATTCWTIVFELTARVLLWLPSPPTLRRPRRRGGRDGVYNSWRSPERLSEA